MAKKERRSEVFAAKLAETARTSPATDTNGLKAALKKRAQQKKQKLKPDKECPKYRCKKKLTDDDAKLCSTCVALGLCHTYSCKKKRKKVMLDCAPNVISSNQLTHRGKNSNGKWHSILKIHLLNKYLCIIIYKLKKVYIGMITKKGEA